MKTIEIEITKTGEVKAEAHGFSGTSCQQATAELLGKLGAVTSDEAKPEMYDTNTNQQQKAGL